MCSCGSISRGEVRLQPPGMGAAGGEGEGGREERKMVGKERSREGRGGETRNGKEGRLVATMLKCMSFQSPLTIHWHRHSGCQYRYALIPTVRTTLNTGNEIVYHWLP